VVSYFGWLIGSILFAKWLDRYDLKKVLLWTIILSATLGLTQLGLTDVALANAVGSNPFVKYLAAIPAIPVYIVAHGANFWGYLMNYDGIVYLNFLLDFWLGILYMISFLPLMKFVALSTPRNLEGTNFAVFASVMNFGLVFGSVSGGWLYEKIQTGLAVGPVMLSGLQITVWLGALTSLIALIALPYIKTENMAHETN